MIAAGRRWRALAAAAVVLVVVSLSWVTAFDLTPPDERPYAGSTQHNSMIELALLHNGLNRFAGPVRRSTGSGDDERSDAPPDDAAGDASAHDTRRRSPLWDRTPVGPLRLLRPHLAAQLAWWLPFVLAAAWLARRREVLAPAKDPAEADLWLWSVWAIAYALVFSFAGGVFHTYYVAVLAPALAALTAIGWSMLWRAGPSGRTAMAFALAATAAWQAVIASPAIDFSAPDWRWLTLAIAAGTPLVCAAMLFKTSSRTPAVSGDQSTTPVWRALASAGFMASLVLPVAWSASVVIVRPNVAAPAADLTALVRATDDDVEVQAARPAARRLFHFLREQWRGERFLVAVPNALLAAPIIVRSGTPVLAMGGYLGRDPILTPVSLQRLIDDGALRFVILGGPRIVPPTSEHERRLAHWIEEHGTPVPAARWREPTVETPTTQAHEHRLRAPIVLYDLRPESGDAGP